MACGLRDAKPQAPRLKPKKTPRCFRRGDWSSVGGRSEERRFLFDLLAFFAETLNLD